MRTFHDGLMLLHILLGAVSLFAFWLPALTRKGGKLHRKAGWFYVWAMFGVVVSAAVLSLLLLTIPLVVRPPSATLSATACLPIYGRYAQRALSSATFPC